MRLRGPKYRLSSDDKVEKVLWPLKQNLTAVDLKIEKQAETRQRPARRGPLAGGLIESSLRIESRV